MKIPNVKLVLLLTLLVSKVLLAQSSLGFGDAHNINSDWKFMLMDESDFKNESLDDKDWEQISLPHDWSVKQQLSPSLASCTGYLPGGIGWYRKELMVPDAKKGQKVFLYFEGVYNRSEVYLNGHLLGKRPNGYISFAYDATEYIKFGLVNTIAVRVDHSQSADSRWYTGSGIYRNVYAVYANPVHIAPWGVFAYPEVKGKKGILHTQVTVSNESEITKKFIVKSEIWSPSGKLVASKSSKVQVSKASESEVKATLKVSNVKLWELESPKLYTLKTYILDGKTVVDSSEVTTGFRTFTFDANKGFALNGKWMKMKGVCLHHDAGVLGAAVPKSVWESRLKTLKTMGVNAVRTSHNPQSPQFYEVCDEIGLLVLNEAYDEWRFPKRKWIKGWNIGEPGFQGSYDIFADWSEKDLAAMVQRDRNHVSVFAWSIGNEVDYPNDPYSHPVLDGGKDTGFAQPAYGGFQKDAPNATELGEIAERLVKVVKQYDTSRPVTAGLAGVAMSNETKYPFVLDIVGYNYTESKYHTDHEKFPERVIYGSENGQGLEAWQAVTANEHIFGQFLWTGFDYLGESGSWPSRGFYTGLVDLAGNIKPRGYFRKSLWDTKPTIYAGTYINHSNRKWLSLDAWPVWNYDNGETIRVVSYTNCTSAKLELNGEVVGEAKPYDAETGVIYWDIPYRSGELKVIGLDGTKETCSYTIQSSNRPFAITAGLPETNYKKGDVVQVKLQIVDENNIPVMLSDNEIECLIKGPGTLLGMEAGNNKDMTDYTDNKQRVFHGKMTIYVEVTDASERIEIKLKSPWLKGTSVSINK